MRRTLVAGRSNRAQIEPSTLFVIRHGETLWNTEGRFAGSLDIELSEHGRKQAAGNAELLRRMLPELGIPVKDVNFVTSPLRRARQSTELIAGALGLSDSRAVTDPRLAEISFGRWEGLTTAQIKQTWNEQRRKRKASRWTVAPPGGESYAMRVPDVVGALSDASPASVVVAHSGIIRIIIYLLSDIGQEEAARTEIPHCGIWLWADKRLFWYAPEDKNQPSMPDSGVFAPKNLM